MSLSTVTVTFDFADVGQGVGQGFVEIAPTAVIVNSIGQTVISDVPVSATLDGSGQASKALIDMGSDGLIPPAGQWAYVFTVSLTGAAPYQKAKIVDLTNGASQAFGELPDAVPATTYFPVTSGGGGGFTNPMTTEGDLIVEDATPAAARLAGNASAVSKFLNSKGDGSAAAVPSWKAITAADLAAVPANPGPGSQLALTPAGLLTWSPYPWKFHPASYGAKGDCKVVTDGAITSGSHALACATSGPFTSADVGKAIVVSGAGGSAVLPLYTTISAFSDSAHVTLTAAASSSVSHGITSWSTDDLPAWKLGLADAYAYWQAHSGGTKLTPDPVLYGWAGAPTVGGATLGNAQLPLPAADPALGKFLPQFDSGLDVTPLIDFEQVVPEATGAFLVCLSGAGTNDGTFGPSYMIGAPIDGYGGEPGLFANVVPTVRGVGTLRPYNATIGGLDFFGCAGAIVDNSCDLPLGVASTTGSVVPNITSPGALTNSWVITGLRMPCAGNNDVCVIGTYSAEGCVYGFMPSEHTRFDAVRTIYCINGGELYSGISSMVHGIQGSVLSAEGCINAVGVFDSAKIDLAVLDGEALTSYVRDINAGASASVISGYIGLRGDIGTGYSASGVLSGGSGGANLKLVNLNNAPGPVASPQAAPASASPWLNGYYRDAWITLKVSSGNITAVSIDATAQAVPASATVYTFLLPSGHSYTPTYSVPSSLTHTVTLI